MTRIRSTTRSLGRRRSRRVGRSPLRPLGGFEREPSSLRDMLAAFRRAIRARRRLARLAPSYHDPALVEHEERYRLAERRRLAECDAALEKVYGPSTPEQRAARRLADEQRLAPAPLHPNTRRAVARESANYEFWKASGELARARYEQFKRRRPHHVMRFSQLLRLLELGLDFGWAATGFDWRNPGRTLPPLPSADAMEADLQRICGSDKTGPDRICVAPEMPVCQQEQASASAGSPASVPAASSVVIVASESHPLGNEVSAAPPTASASPPPAPSVFAPPRRRDAWSSWARQQRQVNGRAGGKP